MEAKTKIAIIGFGNIGKAVLKAVEASPDMEVSCILSRSPNRVTENLEKSLPVYKHDDIEALKKSGAKVAILCGGSRLDLPEQGPYYAQFIHTVDSFDNHSKVPEYFDSINSVAIKAKKISLISAGWDPGTFSLERLFINSFIPGTHSYGFYGVSPKGGLSMGHSDALRRIAGVLDARQYTHAKPEAIEQVRSGKNPNLNPGDMHWRECFVVAKEGANKEAILNEIKTMPGYFAPYQTEVHFISQEELNQNYTGSPHDGLVVGSTISSEGKKSLIEYRNEWDSNPESTGRVLTAGARAVLRLSKEGKTGAITMFDIPPLYYSVYTREEVIRSFL